jgi:glycerol-3-phosphate dehydrogenase
MWPFGCAVAFAQCAVQNGAQVICDCAVTGFVKEDGAVTVVNTTKGAIRTKVVINAAGVYAEEIAKLAGDDSFTITPRKGEYILFDKMAAPSLVYGAIFPCPNEKSKGIMICTTTHGNTFIGPNANEQASKEDTSVTPDGMNEVIAGARKLIPNLPMGASITEFAGLRAVSSTGDFILGASGVPGFINAAGIQSPGLAAAPAIAEVVAEAVSREMYLRKKTGWNGRLPKKPAFNRMTASEKQKMIEKNRLYGRVICRCETVTEGEIVDAIHQPVGARTVDGVKRRTRAGMGRCQGGFCGPRVTQILARELGIPVEKVLKERQGSELFYKKFEE